jgi:hypothetical protein
MSDDLKPNQWYWLRSPDGSLAPYRFHRRRDNPRQAIGEFYVGSFLRRFPLSAVVGEANMPSESKELK